MSEPGTLSNCFEQSPVAVDVIAPKNATPMDVFLTHHAGHSVVDAAPLLHTTETTALKCLDCDIGFAASA